MNVSIPADWKINPYLLWWGRYSCTGRIHSRRSITISGSRPWNRDKLKSRTHHFTRNIVNGLRSVPTVITDTFRPVCVCLELSTRSQIHRRENILQLEKVVDSRRVSHRPAHWTSGCHSSTSINLPIHIMLALKRYLIEFITRWLNALEQHSLVTKLIILP